MKQPGLVAAVGVYTELVAAVGRCRREKRTVALGEALTGQNWWRPRKQMDFVGMC